MIPEFTWFVKLSSAYSALGLANLVFADFFSPFLFNQVESFPNWFFRLGLEKLVSRSDCELPIFNNRILALIFLDVHCHDVVLTARG